jgi:L-ascorbate metabolism protein UlaG (beta-lactamase superfamily)
MKKFYCQILLITTSILASNFGFCQSNEIKIKFIGNCGLYLTDNNSNIYIDFPYKSGAHNYMEYDKSEIDSVKENSTFIFTHKHADHYSKSLLNKIKGNKYGPWNINEIKKIENSISNFTIESFKTQHKVFGISFEHYSYLIVWHNKRIFISGDTESADTVAKINKIDWLFAPSWLIMDAKDKNIKIDAEKIGLYHIGPKDQITSTNPKIQLLNKSGDIIIIPFS